MQDNVFISIYLDTRRPKANRKFPVKLRVFTSLPRKQVLYSTKFEFSQAEFSSIWETAKPRREYKDLRNELQAIELKATQIAEKLTPFTFEAFERKFGQKNVGSTNVMNLYQDIMSKLYDEGRFSTEESYYSTVRSLLEFLCHKRGKKSLPEDFPLRKDFRENGYKDNFDLHEITPKWLLQYEQHCTKNKGTSLTTIGIYLRTLRAVFNSTIEAGNMDKELYPFGKRKYQIPAPRGVKKAFNKNELVKLFYAKPLNEHQEKAQAFWFFSFAANGINIKDIAYLRNENVDKEKIVFYREKTKRTTKSHLTPIIIYLTDKSKAVIKKYGTKSNDPKDFIFPIISNNQTEEEQFTAIRAFNKFINQHLKPLAESIGLTADISTYWARHTFSTQAIRSGQSLEFVGESLGHGSPNTTKTYFAGFEDDKKKEFMKGLMDF